MPGLLQHRGNRVNVHLEEVRVRDRVRVRWKKDWATTLTLKFFLLTKATRTCMNSCSVVRIASSTDWYLSLRT